MHAWLLLTIALSAEPAVWPGFLGAGASPLVAEQVPLTWSPVQNIAWKTMLAGKGQSSPVVWGTTVYVTSIVGANKEQGLLYALALKDGAQLWRREHESAQQTESNYFQSRAAPTPVADAQGVYAFFETGDVLAYTHEGVLRWRRRLTKDYGEFKTSIGLSASPVQTQDLVILQVDHEGPSYLLGLDKRSGETRWKTERKSSRSYCSPFLLPVAGGGQQVVCSADGLLAGYDPASGERLWEFTELGGNSSTTPLPFGEGRLLVGAAPGQQGERESEAKRSNLALEVVREDAAWRPRVLWRNEKTTPTFASPLVYRGHAYWVNRVGVVYCFDSETGEQRFAERTRQMCWATPIGVGERVYFFGKDGVTTVLAAGAKFERLAENSLWDAAEGVDPLNARREQAERERGGTARPATPGAEAEKPSATANNSATPGDGRPAARPGTAGGRPAPGSPEEQALRRQMAGKFADPVQYGVAMAGENILIRSGDKLYCVRETRVSP